MAETQTAPVSLGDQALDVANALARVTWGIVHRRDIDLSADEIDALAVAHRALTKVFIADRRATGRAD
jgi:hypothetical protein